LTDLREDFEEKRRQNQELEEERNELTRQLQMAIGRADSESLAKSIAHETIAELEKEKTMKELEIKDLTARHKTETTNKDIALSAVMNSISYLNKSNSTARITIRSRFSFGRKKWNTRKQSINSRRSEMKST
jgi:predicted lipid-binding transport protein (Tim44 family)